MEKSFYKISKHILLMHIKQLSNQRLVSGIAFSVVFMTSLSIMGILYLPPALGVMMDNNTGMMMDNNTGMMMDNPNSGMMMDNNTGMMNK